MNTVNTKNLMQYIAWRQLQRVSVADLPLARRIRGKLRLWGDVASLLAEDIDVLCRELTPDEGQALREVVHAIRNHPGAGVVPLGRRPRHPVADAVPAEDP